MFTGLVESIGIIEALSKGRHGMAATIKATFPDGWVALGDSVAVEGCCLTVTDMPGTNLFTVDVSPETLSLSTLGSITVGAKVNLERSLTPTSRMGGHFVSGHVDAMGSLQSAGREGSFHRWEISVPKELIPFIAPKGSVALNGVSLTVNRWTRQGVMELMLIPHTFSITTLGARTVGDSINIEVDMLARYVARILQTGGKDSPNNSDTDWHALLGPIGNDYE